MNTTKDNPTETFSTLLASLGVTVEASAPSPGVDPAADKGGRPWPHIAYTVTVYRNGRKVWAGPYKLGVGHVTYPKPPAAPMGLPRGMWRDEADRVARVLARTPGASFTPELHARAAVYFANIQGVSPGLPDVLGSLLLDGSPYFDGGRFEEWAPNVGLSPDSIKAKELFETCVSIGRDLTRAFNAGELAKLRELAAEL